MGQIVQMPDNNYQHTCLIDYKESHSGKLIVSLVLIFLLIGLLVLLEEGWFHAIIGSVVCLIIPAWMLLPQTRLRVFPNYTIIRPRLGEPMRYRFPNSDVVSVMSVPQNPFKEFRPGLLYRWKRWPTGSKWDGWKPCFNWPGNSAIAIETAKEKYLVSCNKPEEIVAKLKEIYGVPV